LRISTSSKNGCNVLQVAPLDFLQADEVLSKEVVDGVHRDSHMWMADNFYSLVPWSCCVLEAIPWDDAPTYGPYSSVLEPVTFAKAPAPKVGHSPGPTPPSCSLVCVRLGGGVVRAIAWCRII